jgi:hypothetical protein
MFYEHTFKKICEYDGTVFTKPYFVRYLRIAPIS